MSRGIEVIVAFLVCGLAVTRMMVSELPWSWRPSIPWSTPKTKMEIGFRAAILALVAVFVFPWLICDTVACRVK